MQIVSAVAAVAAALTLATTQADACSLIEGMDAKVYPTSAEPVGHRPWIQVMGMERSSEVTLVIVDKKCPKRPKAPCKGKSAPYVREGDILRPSENLPSGARVQIQRTSDTGVRIVEDFSVRTTKPTAALPVWSGATLTKTEWLDPSLQGCGYGGVRVGVAVTKTTSDLSDAMVLFYTSKPDPAHLEKGLVDMASPEDLTPRPSWSTYAFDPGGNDAPAKAWIVLADGDGHVGEPIELAPALSPQDAKKLAAWNKKNK